MSRTLKTLALAAVVSLALPISSAVAQDSDDEKAARAQEAFDRGAAFYVEGQYGRALIEFKKANRAYPNAMFVLNMALAHGKLGQYDEAISAVDEASEMGGLNGKALALAQGASSAWGSIDRATSIAESRAPVADASGNEGLEDPGSARPSKSDDSLGTLGTVGVVFLSLGVVGGAVTGGYYGLVVTEKVEACPLNGSGVRECSGDVYQEATDAQNTGLVLLGSSVGLGVIGGLLLGTDLLLGSESDSSAVVVPVVGPDYTGASMRFTF